MVHSEETTIQIGEPQLSDDGEDDAEEDDEKDDKEEKKNKDKDKKETGGKKDSGTSDGDGDDDGSVTSEEKGTSYSDVKDSSTGNYGDYVDTIVDLIESLVGLDD